MCKWYRPLSDRESRQHKLLAPSIPIGFLNDALQASHFRGMDTQALLRANGFTLADLAKPGVRISVERYSQILRLIRVQTDDAFFGFLSRPVPVKAFNVFCYSVVGCRNLDEVLKQANDFYQLFTDDFSWSLAQEGGDIVVTIDVRPTLPIDYRFVIQSLSLLTIKLFGWLLGEDLEAKSVNFCFAEHSTDENLSYLFGDQVNYDCEDNSFRLSGHYGAATLSCTRDQIALMLRGTRYLFLLSRNRDPVSQQVRRLLLSNKYQQWLEVEAVAEKLNISPNQLWRKLKKENTSFLELRDQIKHDWALVLLEDPAFTVEGVADSLHYSDTSAFRKAFKKWTGLQPAQYRSMLSPPSTNIDPSE